MASVTKRTWTYKGAQKEAWTVRYKDAGGVHRSKAFDLKKQADDFRKKVERELDDGTHIARRNSRTMAELIVEYLAHQQRRADEGQISQAGVDAIGRALRPAQDHMSEIVVSTLTWQQAEKYGHELRRRKATYTNRTLANGTVNNGMAVLSRMMNYAARRGYVARNVVPDAIKELGHLPSAHIQTFSHEEMQTLISLASDRGYQRSRRSQQFMKVALYLGAMCGLRRGEILGLRWEAINFDEGTISITKSLTNLDELKCPKTEASIRIIPMPFAVAEALEEWRPFVIEDERKLILRNGKGKQFADNNFYKGHWHPLLRRAGMTGMKGYHRRFHATRHFAGSHWLSVGVPLPEVSRLLGHANMAITAKIYSHVIREVHHQAPAMNRCADMLIGKPVTQGLRIAA